MAPFLSKWPWSRAISKASMIRVVRIWLAVDQSTIIRVHRSITVARYSHPELVRRYVMSPQNRVPGVAEVKSRVPSLSSMWF